MKYRNSKSKIYNLTSYATITQEKAGDSLSSLARWSTRWSVVRCTSSIMQYYNFALVFLLCLKVSFTDCQTLPYSLTKTDRELKSNTLTLQCMGRLGSVVPNAVFYRNGVLNTSDDCFNSSVSVATNKLRFTISPECDGHYMCGARSGNGVVLSNSITIHGEYFHLSRYPFNQNLHINSL